MHNTRWPNHAKLHAGTDAVTPHSVNCGVYARCVGTLFAYAPDLWINPDCATTNTDKLFDEIYLFDGRGESENNIPYDISGLPPADGILPRDQQWHAGIAGAQPGAALLRNERNAQTEPVRAGASDLENYGSGMGCAAVRTPLEPTRRLAELRLLHHTLFDARARVSLAGAGLATMGNRQRPQISTPTVADVDVDDFLHGTGLARVRQSTAGILGQRLADYLGTRMNDGKPCGCAGQRR